ncbi:metal ABC transporter permease, partial [Streptomyces sp. NPDC052107]|uniref:metal ABC transporter permease n=1 Tax=Streptomyces sp. NPDC052107 TaxID=3155632 RepID=UPI00341465FA
LYRGLLEGPQTILFGTFLGITSSQVTVLTVVGAVVLAVLALIGRPLLFASVDPQVAAGRGVPVRALSVVFLVCRHHRSRVQNRPDQAKTQGHGLKQRHWH